MLGLLIMFSFWIAITIMVLVPLILTFALGSILAEKLGLDGFEYYAFMILFYAIVLCLLVVL